MPSSYYMLLDVRWTADGDTCRTELLSEKATAGFYSRTQRAKLRFAPGFIRAVAVHLERMRGDQYEQASRRAA